MKSVLDCVPCRNGEGSRLNRFRRLRRLYDRVRVLQGIPPRGELTAEELARIDQLFMRRTVS
jgi:hypothetical protein